MVSTEGDAAVSEQENAAKPEEPSSAIDTDQRPDAADIGDTAPAESRWVVLH